MPGWRADAPGRRVGVAVVLGTLAVVWAATSALGLLLPSARPIAEDRRPRTATCDDPMADVAPVPVTSGSLFGCPAAFDGRLVRLRGEAIGDLLRGPGGRRWVQVNDDAYASVGPLGTHRRTLGSSSGTAVLLPAGADVAVLGGPGVHGDALDVVGVFEAAAEADQGGPAVIAEAVEVTGRGGPVADLPALRVRWAAAVAVLVTLALGSALRRRRRLERA
jgi:hypothetical protein